MTDDTKKKSWWQIGGRRARLEELEGIAHEQSSEIESLQGQLKALQEKHQAAIDALHEANQERDNLEQRYTESNKLVGTLKTEQKSQVQHQTQLAQENQQLKKTISQQQEQLTTLNQQQSSTKDQASELHQALTEQREAYEAQEEKLIQLQRERDEALKQQASLEDIVRETSELLQRMGSEKRELESQQKQSSAKVQEAEKAASVAKKSALKAQKQTALAQQENATLQEQLTQAQQERTTLQTELTNAQKQAALAQQENATLQEQLTQAQEHAGQGTDEASLQRQQLSEQWSWSVAAKATALSCGNGASLALATAWEEGFDAWYQALGGPGDKAIDSRFAWLSEVLQQLGWCQGMTWHHDDETVTLEVQLSLTCRLLQEISVELWSPIPTLCEALLQHTPGRSARMLACYPLAKQEGFKCTYQWQSE